MTETIDEVMDPAVLSEAELDSQIDALASTKVDAEMTRMIAKWGVEHSSILKDEFEGIAYQAQNLLDGYEASGELEALLAERNRRFTVVDGVRVARAEVA